jgi:hypothetical protein
VPRRSEFRDDLGPDQARAADDDDLHDHPFTGFSYSRISIA